MRVAKEVRAFAPATVSNLGPGFDVLGLALREPGDTVTARVSSSPGVCIRRIDGDEGKLPLQADANTAGIAATAVLRQADIKLGIELDLEKGLPIGSGLGSSASSAVAAAYAVNVLLGSPLRKQQLVQPCLEAEAMVAGRHADNVVPCLLGGMILVRSVDPLDVIRLPVPEGLMMVVSVPDFELATRKARAALPNHVSIEAMVNHSANLSALVSALHTNDIDLITRCIVDDVVTPARAKLIPGACRVMDAAVGAGALASSISGAGPAIFALCHSPSSAERVASAMIQAFSLAGLQAVTHVSPMDCPGVRRP